MSVNIQFYKETFSWQLYLPLVNFQPYTEILSWQLHSSNPRLKHFQSNSNAVLVRDLLGAGIFSIVNRVPLRTAKPNKIPYQNRKCKVLEDEFHFLLECHLYTDLRKRYINKFFWTRPNMLKFIELMSIDHGNMLKQLSVFIEKAFQWRKEIILLWNKRCWVNFGVFYFLLHVVTFSLKTVKCSASL